jgi:hypothetical protein
MTRRQLLAALACSACGAPLLAAAQQPESDAALQTVTLIVDGMT